MNKLPKSWAVRFYKAPGINHPVIQYLRNTYNTAHKGSSDNCYYGVSIKHGAISSQDKWVFAKILTEEEFLKLTKTMTKQEIENYKDFKKGDILKHVEMFGRYKTPHFCKVVETLGDLIWISLLTSDVKNIINNVNSQPYFRQNLYNANYRLYIPEEKIQEEILELTLEDIAAKYGKSVTEIKIKK